MASWTTLTELFERLTDPGAHAGNLREEELRLAAAALLVHATAIDGEVATEERRKLKALLQTHFGLGDDEARRLIREAKVRDHDAVDLYRFTSVLCAQLDQDGRKQIIEMLWEIAMADAWCTSSSRTSSGGWLSCLGSRPAIASCCGKQSQAGLAWRQRAR